MLSLLCWSVAWSVGSDSMNFPTQHAYKHMASCHGYCVTSSLKTMTVVVDILIGLVLSLSLSLSLSVSCSPPLVKRNSKKAIIRLLLAPLREEEEKEKEAEWGLQFYDRVRKKRRGASSSSLSYTPPPPPFKSISLESSDLFVCGLIRRNYHHHCRRRCHCRRWGMIQ